MTRSSPTSCHERPVSALAVGLALGLGATTACGNGPSAPARGAAAAVADDSFDPCEGSKPPAKEFLAILRGVRCEQEQFLRMAKVADDLGVDCNHCHVRDPSKRDGYFYDQSTEKKDTARWMHEAFITGLRRRDGAPMTCSACHVDKAGKPAAKFLGEPRDVDFAVEWMTSVMTTRFETVRGEKLKCKSCHVGGWGTPTFEKRVIGRSEQVPHGPVPLSTGGSSASPAEVVSATPAEVVSASPPPMPAASAPSSASPDSPSPSNPSPVPPSSPPKN